MIRPISGRTADDVEPGKRRDGSIRTSVWMNHGRLRPFSASSP